MSKIQWIWLIVALVLFIAIGAVSAWRTNQTSSNMMDMVQSNLTTVSSLERMTLFPSEDFIAKIGIEGTITSDGSTSGLIYGTGGFSESAIVDYIDALIECPSNVGILLYIDSGGGEMGASDNIYLKLMDYKEATGRPVYAFFENTACSGAYYIAMAADDIWANRNCICVNIGVYIETYNLAKLFEKYGVEEIMIKSSENKGIGAMGTPWTDEQKAIYQSIVDLYYDQFLDVVSKGRGMTKELVRALDDGREMLASQALSNGFIDGICRYEEYEEMVLARHDGAYIYEQPASSADFTSLFNYLYGKLEALIPISDVQALQDFISSHDSLVVMAYAG